MTSFRKALSDNNILIFDGGLGTLLQAKGMPAGQSPEEFGLASPKTLEAVHSEYRNAGARVLTTNSFGGTRYKLKPGINVRELNRAMARAARQAAGDSGFVAGSVGPTGQFVKPLGKLDFEELVDAFKEQIQGLAEGGADLILAETHFDLAEAKAVAIAARLVTDLPLGVSMTFEKNVSLTGTSPLTFVDTFQNLGVDLIATNCSAGPDELFRVVENMLPRLSIPLLVQPNAGLPELREGRTIFPMGPEEFAEKTARFVELGAKALGGCCGTTPEHIARLVALTSGMSWRKPAPDDSQCLVLTTRSASVSIGLDRPLTIIGERINPTGRKAFSEELQAGGFNQALILAEEQINAGAQVLDVNVGAPMVDETRMLPQVAEALTGRFKAPLCLDSSNPDALEAALLRCPGSALLNSISGEPGHMERLAPLCKLHGAACILLPLQGRRLPETAAERIQVIEALVEKAVSLGLPRRLLLVDVLVLTVSSKGTAAKECFQTIRHCAEVLKLPTVMGLSNISFGLPARELINSAFLAMSMTQGLTSCIANPAAVRVREMQAAADLLLGRDPQAESFISGYGSWKPGGGGPAPGTPAGKAAKVETLEEAVIKGDKENILRLVEEALERGDEKPYDLVDKRLIPAINHVGELYERKEYFLPQLILSAETMKRAFQRLRPLLEEEAQSGKRHVVVLATVEGDIHDIGKNIVSLMLSNHGFQVEDLGKDVPARTIVDKAKELDASLIGLSALMTTTMVRMADTISLLAEEGLDIPVMVGGAVVTEAFAQSISASGYAPDAVSAVRLASMLTGQSGMDPRD